jgi:prophage regulatory protein
MAKHSVVRNPLSKGYAVLTPEVFRSIDLRARRYAGGVFEISTSDAMHGACRYRQTRSGTITTLAMQSREVRKLPLFEIPGFRYFLIVPTRSSASCLEPIYATSSYPGNRLQAKLLGDPKAEPPILPIIPVGASTLWRWVNAGTFPKPVKLSERVTAWNASQVQDWIDAKHGGSQGQKAAA